MNKNMLKTFFALLLLISLVGCGMIPQTGSTGPITASGTIQAESIRLAAEIGGKIQEIKVRQGDLVQQGDVLFRLDDSGLQPQRQQAAAALQAAQAAQAAAQSNLDLIKAGPTEDQVRAAQAQLDQLEADRNAAQAALWNAEGNNRPEDISAGQARLDLARRQYYQLAAALSTDQVEQAFAVLTQAQSTLAQLQSRRDRMAEDKRLPPDVLEAADNAIVDAQAIVDYAKQANQLVQDDSQPLYVQIAAVRKTWEIAQLNLSQAQARLTTLRAEKDMLQEGINAAQEAVDETQSLSNQAKKSYDSLNNSSQAGRLKAAWNEMQNAQRDFNALGSTTTGGANLETMLNELNSVTSQRDSAQANLNNVKNGSRTEQVAAAQAQLDAAKAKVVEAQAALSNIDVQISKLAVVAPTGGIILNKLYDAGEIAPAGTAVVEMGNLDQITLKVYIPEDQYGKIQLGQPVSVKVDSFPGRTFPGTVTNIADQAEFTPRNVQTQETRSTTVYAIEIHLPNPDHALKPGMPADATF